MKTDTKESKKKKELEERLRKAFPEKWILLSDNEKKIAIERFYTRVWKGRITIEEAFVNIRNKGVSYGLLFLGAVTALLGGLVVNILDRFFLYHFGLVYEILIPIIFVLVLYFLYREFEESINEEYRYSDFLDVILKDDTNFGSEK
jgi:hypothetical protein